MALQSEITMRLDKNILDPKEIILRMPKVGQILYRTPTTYIHSEDKLKPQLCHVTYVNKEHLWYEVEFEIEGKRHKESYKLPFSVDSSRESVYGGLFV